MLTENLKDAERLLRWVKALDVSLNDDVLLRRSQLTGKPGQPGLLGISKASLYRLLAAGKFPKPIRPLPGVVAWRAGDVRNWLRSHSQDQGVPHEPH